MKIRILFLLCLFCVGVCALVFANAAWLSKERAGAPVEVTIKQGASFDDVVKTLSDEKFVSAPMYRVYALMNASVKRPKAGVYSLRRGAPYSLIASKLAKGPVRAELTVRLVEGKTIEDNAVALGSLGVESAVYFGSVGRSANIVPFDRSLATEFSFLSDVPNGQSLEGYLFPDTYQVWEDELPEGLIHRQLSTLQSKIIDPNADVQKKSGMTWHEILTLASVVEGEVRTSEDRKIVADIFLRRMKNGMRLQSDATLNYVMKERNDRPDAEDLAIDSPYNTYDHDGLPPGPVNNPGLSAISAVLDPTSTDYFYFLTDKNGKVYYAKTYDEHLANKRKYMKSR